MELSVRLREEQGRTNKPEVDIYLERAPKGFSKRYPLDKHEEVCAALMKAGVKFRPVPRDLILFFQDRNQSSRFDEARLQSLQTWAFMRDYQKRALRRMLQCGGRVLNMSEMGTGKTCATVSFLEYWKGSDNLIVCPASLLTNWQQEISKFSGLASSIVRKRSDVTHDGINIMSYSIASHLPTSKVWGTVVLDESHYIKNAASKRSKHLLKITKRAERVVLLSGTPLSKSRDLFTQLKALYPDTFKKFSQLHSTFGRQASATSNQYFFGDRYCNPTVQYLAGGRKTYVFNGNTKSEELHAITSAVGVRILKRNVLSLPEKIRKSVTIHEMDAKVTQQELLQIQKLRDERGKARADAKLTSLVLKHSRSKLPFVAAYVRALFQSGLSAKTIFFAHHRNYVQMLQAEAARAGVSAFVIDGQTPNSKRQTYIDDFRQTSKFQIGILSITACGVGLNFSFVSEIIFTELCWSDSLMIQAEDRCHRLGQQRPVSIQYLMVAHSMDDVIWRSICGKQYNSRRTMDNVHSRPSFTNI